MIRLGKGIVTDYDIPAVDLISARLRLIGSPRLRAATVELLDGGQVASDDSAVQISYTDERDGPTVWLRDARPSVKYKFGLLVEALSQAEIDALDDPDTRSPHPVPGAWTATGEWELFNVRLVSAIPAPR